MKNDIRKQLLVRFPLKSSSQLDEVIESGVELRASEARAAAEDFSFEANEAMEFWLGDEPILAFFQDGEFVALASA